MIQRCINPKRSSYPRYGAKGVTVCDRWRDFVNFLADMGERPIGTTLGRVLDMGNYEPGNCFWMTPEEQSLARRNRKAFVDESFGLPLDPSFFNLITLRDGCRSSAAAFAGIPHGIAPCTPACTLRARWGLFGYSYAAPPPGSPFEGVTWGHFLAWNQGVTVLLSLCITSGAASRDSSPAHRDRQGIARLIYSIVRWPLSSTGYGGL
jgi:hypothetical protein